MRSWMLSQQERSHWQDLLPIGDFESDETFAILRETVCKTSEALPVLQHGGKDARSEVARGAQVTCGAQQVERSTRSQQPLSASPTA